MNFLLSVIRGASTAGLAAGAILGTAVLVGLAPGANRLVFVFVASAAFVHVAISERSHSAAAAGAMAPAAIGLGSGLITGFGWLEGSLVTGGALATASLFIKPARVRVRSASPFAAIAVAVAVAALIPLVIGGGTLGHDESAYALKALSWLEGTPETGWSLHRAPLLSAYAYPVMAFGGEEPALRITGVVALAGLASAVWWLGRRMYRPVVGAVSAVVIVASPAMLRRATEFLTDIPAAALLVGCMALIWNQFERREGGHGYGLLWLLPLAWTAFYLRYQSILTLGLIGLTVLILWWPKVRRRPGPVVATAIVGLGGLVPHAVHAGSETGSPIGILLTTGQVAGREFLGEGLLDYADLIAWPLAGLVGIPLVVLFLWSLVLSWRDPVTRRPILFLAIPALGQVVALGLISHGESRFVFFSLGLVAVGAVAGAIRVTGELSLDLGKGLRAGLLALLAGSVVLSVAATRASVENRLLSNEPVEMSAEFVETASEGRDCAVMTSYLPQITFYSGCSTRAFDTRLEAVEAVGRLDASERYMVLIDDGKRQPVGSDLQQLIDEAIEQARLSGQRDGALVFKFDAD